MAVVVEVEAVDAIATVDMFFLWQGCVRIGGFFSESWASEKERGKEEKRKLNDVGTRIRGSSVGEKSGE